MAERGNVSVARLFRGGDVRWQQKAPRLKTRATSDGASCRGTACGARPKVENGSLSTEVSGTMTKEGSASKDAGYKRWVLRVGHGVRCPPKG